MAPKSKSTSSSTAYASDLEYLEHELQWIEARCIQIGARRRIVEGDSDPLEPDNRPEQHTVTMLRAKAREALKRERRYRNEIDLRLTVTRRTGKRLGLDELCATYGLGERERVAVLLATAVCISQRFETLFGLLSGTLYGSTRASVETLFEFLELPFAERVRTRSIFAKRAPLVANEVIELDIVRHRPEPEDLLAMGYKVSKSTFDALLGEDALGDELAEFSVLEDPLATLDQVVLDEADKTRILSVVDNHARYLECRREWGFDETIRYGRGAMMLFHGQPGTGKTMMAHAVADRMGKRVLAVDIPTFLESRVENRFLVGLFREARARDALLFFDECETLFQSRRMGNPLLTLLLSELERFEGVAVLATNLPETLDDAFLRRILVRVEFPAPGRSARAAIWSSHLPAAAPIAADVDIDALATRYECSGGYIKNAVLAAVAAAVHENPEDPSIEMKHLERAVADQVRPVHDEGHELSYPKAALTDLILPSSLTAEVEELIDAARNRRLVLERWGIGRHLTTGKGVSALLHGPPGTGKSLCAQVIARELHRPLMTCSMAAVQSKWVGQTEKNLTSLFSSARSHNAVLFLDEADSLLTERGEGRASRHDDAAVNVLLQLIERHEGIVVLATNLPKRLDPALSRRLAFQLEFPLPGVEARERIWRGLLPDTVPTDGSVDLRELARRFEMSGGHIRNAVFKAAHRAAAGAGVVTQGLLRAAAESVCPKVGAGKVVGFGG